MVTVLVAPRSYQGERDLYDKSVNLEKVAEMLASPNLSAPQVPTGDHCTSAKEESGDRRPNSGPRNAQTSLRLSGTAPKGGYRPQDAVCNSPRSRMTITTKDSWVDKIRHPDFPDHVWLRHRLWTSQQASQTGMVDLIVSPASSDEREWFKAGAPEEFIEDTYGRQKQGILFSLPVMEIRQSTGFCEATATEAFDAMDRLTVWFLRLDKR